MSIPPHSLRAVERHVARYRIVGLLVRNSFFISRPNAPLFLFSSFFFCTQSWPTFSPCVLFNLPRNPTVLSRVPEKKIKKNSSRKSAKKGRVFVQFRLFVASFPIPETSPSRPQNKNVGDSLIPAIPPSPSVSQTRFASKRPWSAHTHVGWVHMRCA